MYIKQIILLTLSAIIGTTTSQTCPPSVSNDTGLLSVWNGKCYHFLQTALTWAQANASCSSMVEGGVLATIPDSNTQAYIYNRADALSEDGITSKNDYWLGGVLANNGQDHTWITGESSTYTRWDTGHPNNTNGNCLYMALTRDGAWRTNDCSAMVWPYGYICTYNLVGSGAITTAAPSKASRGASNSILYLAMTLMFWKVLSH